MHHVTMNVGQSHVAAAEAEGGLGVFDAQQVQHGCMEVVYLGAFVHGLVAPLVSRSVNGARLHSATGQPNREPVLIVIATILPLGEWCAAKFAGPDDQCFIEQAALSKVLEQRSDRLVNCQRIIFVSRLEAVMLIPTVAFDLGTGQFDEADAAFDHASGNQALPSIDASGLVLRFQTIFAA